MWKARPMVVRTQELDELMNSLGPCESVEPSRRLRIRHAVMRIRWGFSTIHILVLFACGNIAHRGPRDRNGSRLSDDCIITDNVWVAPCGFRKLWRANSGNSGTVCRYRQVLLQVQMTGPP